MYFNFITKSQHQEVSISQYHQSLCSSRGAYWFLASLSPRHVGHMLWESEIKTNSYFTACENTAHSSCLRDMHVLKRQVAMYLEMFNLLSWQVWAETFCWLLMLSKSTILSIALRNQPHGSHFEICKVQFKSAGLLSFSFFLIVIFFQHFYFLWQYSKLLLGPTL